MEKYLGKHLVAVENKEAKLSLLNNTDFMTCDKCKYDKMRVKYSKRGQLFSACNGFPEWKNTMNLPVGITYLEKTSEVCKTCESKKR